MDLGWLLCGVNSMQRKLSGCGVTLEELTDKAILALQTFAPEQGYYGCFSGGKDSVVIKELARLARVKVDWYYNQTTIDPPELIKFIKTKHGDVEWVRPKQNFFTAMERRGFPTRRNRWCCQEYKEGQSPEGAFLILGVRAAESPRRKAAWKLITHHTRTKNNAISPIIAWSDEDVWEFIRSHKIPYCRLYDEGFDRLGCIGCPMARKAARIAEFARWPGYERAWRRTFQRIWDRKAGTKQRDGREWFGSARFSSWEGMWDWWLSDDSLPGTEGDECQGMLELWG